MPVSSVAPEEPATSYEIAPIAKVGQNVTLDGRYSTDNDVGKLALPLSF
ncbi:MAG: hypothetical protein WB392_14555 [Methanotrichaceae archaeon]